MHPYPFTLETLVSRLDGGLYLAEALFHPEATALGHDPQRLAGRCARLATRVLERLPLLEVHRRCVPEELATGEVVVEIEPPHGPAWSTPVRLRLDVVRWTAGRVAVALVPALGIEVLAPDDATLAERIQEEIRFALMRAKALTTLRPLAWLARRRGLERVRQSVMASLRSPREAATASEEKPPSVLKEAGTELAKHPLAPAFEVDDLVSRLAEALTIRAARGVLLVGPSGAGKTAVLHELVRRRRDFGLGRTPFWSTSGSRLISGAGGFGAWQDRLQDLVEEARRTRAVVHFGNLMELLQVGRCEGNDQGVADFLRSAIERGQLGAVVECTAEQLAAIERERPALPGAFLRIDVAEPPVDRGRTILRRFADVQRPGVRPAITPEAVDQLDRLHRRYATYSAYPGRPLRFLRNLLADLPQGGQLTSADVTRAFSRESGLPLVLLEETVPLRLDETRRWLASRVIGQDEAVERVVDLLATIKQGLSTPRRPIASLLFIGPTGVGKTEMAKALAEFLYQDRRRMTRIDMSEYADAWSIDRLIGGTFQREGVLTARVREQPFGVVLLDEFEKAHPRFFDLLLQVLDEGRLTDGAGRLADFRNSVIVMTSNLGADTFGRGHAGFGDDSTSPSAAREHFERQVREFLRPEMYNRIDRIVPFLPLSQPVLEGIARRELDGIGRREGLQHREVEIALDPALPDYVVHRGYDPRYGARPILRAIERELLAPLSAAMNEYGDDLGLLASAARAEGGLKVQVRARRAEEISDQSGHSAAFRREVQGAATLRRATTALAQSEPVLALRNEIFRLEKLRERRGAAAYDATAAELAQLQELVDRTDGLAAAAIELEDRVLVPFYTGGSIDLAEAEFERGVHAADCESLLLDLYAREFETPDAVLVAVYGHFDRPRHALVRAYYELCRNRGAKVSLYEMRIDRPREGKLPLEGEFLVVSRAPEADAQAGSEEKTPAPATVLRVRQIELAEEYLAAEPLDVLALALSVRGRLVYPLFSSEVGTHQFIERTKELPCWVDVAGGPMTGYAPPAGIDRRGAIADRDRRRTYQADQALLLDRYADRRLRWSWDDLAQPLGDLLDRRLLDRALAWLGLPAD